MSGSLRSTVLRYGCAFASVSLAIGARLLLDPVLGEQFPFATVLFAVLVTAWYGGFRPALVAVVLGALASDFFLLAPRGSIQLAGSIEQVGLLLFVLTGLGISLLAGALHAARRRAESTADSVRHHAALIDQTYDALHVWEWNGPISFWNRGAERLYGFSREEALGRTSHDLLQTSTPGGVASFLAILEREGSWEGELRHTSRDGHTIIVDTRMMLIREPARNYVVETNRDITQRKSAEAELRDLNQRLEARVLERAAQLEQSNEKLRAHEERSRLILEGVRSHAIFMLDPAGNVASWNAGAELINGYTAPEILGENFSRFYTSPDIASGKPQLELEIAARQGFFEEEGFRVRKDGSVFWAMVTITPLYNQPGAQPIGFVKVTQNISDRKKMQEALRVSEDRFHLLVDGVSDHAILMLDPEGTILTWSSGAERIDGYTAEEIVGHHYSCLFTPELIAEGKPGLELERAAAEGKVDVEGWRVRKNGSRFWVNGTLSALYDEKRTVQGFAKITRDLTAKRRNDELLQSVLNHTLDGIVGIDERGTISMMNRAGEKIFGRSASEVVGQNVKMLMPEPYHGEHDAYLGNYKRTREAKIIGIGREVQGLRKDGSTFPLDLAVTEFQLDNQRYFVGIVRDISEKKKLEAQLHQSQKMEAFGQLAGGVAHDFNNLLTVISGYSEMLLTKLPPDDPKIKMVDQVRRAGERASSLTRQLLAFSRQQVLEPKVLDLNVIVSDLEKMLRRLIGEDVQFTIVLALAISAVKVDAGQIEQVIINLAVNARDAMPQGGKLTIETRDAELDESYAKTHPEARGGRFVLVAISDTGCGMTPDVKARIFEPFYTTKGVGQGTGLGLAVVHGIVKQSGGNIDVYSEVGVGTTVRIYLPAVEQPVASSAAHGLELPSRGSETILLVEDEESVRELATFVLQECGYTVMTAPEGLAALSLVASCREKIDLLLTDVVMPQMGGRKLAETLLAEHPELRVLFMSGYTDDAVVRHGVLQANANFLQKPFTPNSLAKKVREVLDHP
jgi:two-component system, cell cycle sensor histidine kinase and response regulator CckA